MEFRLGAFSDLPALKAVYAKIVESMDEAGICIWDDVYPCEFFAEDIEKKSLYLLTDGGDMLGSFTLSDANDGADAVVWKYTCGKAMYIEKLGVNVAFRGRGIGAKLIGHAEQVCLAMGANALRLFVAQVNAPAIKLYEKSGFVRASGTYAEVIGPAFTLIEYGYEKPLGNANGSCKQDRRIR